MSKAYSKSEMMAVAGARELQDGEVVATGIGLPQISSVLAKMTHAPNLTIILEIGIVDPHPETSSVGIADPRLWYKAACMSSFLDVLGMGLHRGRIDVAFLGGLETDPYGNLNTTLIRKPEGGIRHFLGSGGANDLASLAKHTLVIMRHEKRKFNPKVSFITSPGFLDGAEARKKAGLPGGGPRRIITDKCVLGFDDATKRMSVVSVHPGITIDDVVENTGFELVIPSKVPETEPPTDEQLRLIREKIDPDKDYVGGE